MDQRQFPHLFSPITIGGVTFKNRIWAAPASCHLLNGVEGYPSEDVIAYYAAKARGGSAALTFSAQNMDTQRPYDPLHAHEDVLNREYHRFWRKLTEAVHYYDARIGLELLEFHHHGYDANGKLVSYSVNGERTVTAETFNDDGSEMPMLPRSEMEVLAQRYADAAEAAVDCGFDLLFIHSGHGVLLSQFLSPLYNKRTDEFGGSLENRARFPLMILDAIRARVGRKILIEYRISGDELAGPDGFTAEDCIAYLKLIQDRIDIAHVSAGSFLSDTEHITHPNLFLPAGCNAHLAARVKASPEIHIPVLTLGAFQEPQLMEDTLAAGGADLIAMARGTIAEPELPNKARTGRADEITPCIRCMHCADFTRPGYRTFDCSANPTTGREWKLSHLVPPAGEKKRLVVIGGGPAGMQAALTARERGHEVILLERAGALGGKLVFSRQVPFKNDLRRFLDYLIHMVEKRGVDVRLNTEATPGSVAALKPDAVFSAVGADAFLPNIPGMDRKNVITAEECYARAAAGEDLGREIVFLGGGEVGCETAIYLKQLTGAHVSIVEMLPRVADDVMPLNRAALMERLADCALHAGAVCEAIMEEGLVYSDAAGRHTIPADTVVVSAGMRPRAALAESFRGTADTFCAIGDCVRASNVRNATHTAFNAASRL